MRGKGVGSRLVADHVEELDAGEETGYLETDKADNVRFYRRFGFEVVAGANVLGVPNWFMVRPPAAPTRTEQVGTATTGELDVERVGPATVRSLHVEGTPDGHRTQV